MKIIDFLSKYGLATAGCTIVAGFVMVLAYFIFPLVCKKKKND